MDFHPKKKKKIYIYHQHWKGTQAEADPGIKNIDFSSCQHLFNLLLSGWVLRFGDGRCSGLVFLLFQDR